MGQAKAVQGLIVKGANIYDLGLENVYDQNDVAFVSFLKIETSLDGLTFTDVLVPANNQGATKNQADHQAFRAVRSKHYALQDNRVIIGTAIQAQYVKILPLTWSSSNTTNDYGIVMRVGVLVSTEGDSSCGTADQSTAVDICQEIDVVESSRSYSSQLWQGDLPNPYTV